MKKTVCLILSLVLALCLLTGCGKKEAVDTSADTLRVVSATQVHTPHQNWIYSYKDGVASDGTRLTVEEMLAKTAADTAILTIPFATAASNAADNGVYSVYDLEGNEIYRHHLVFTDPKEAGMYLCVLEMHFGSDKVYSGYQLFWRFVVTEADLAEKAK